jgi:hypothetical protein
MVSLWKRGRDQPGILAAAELFALGFHPWDHDLLGAAEKQLNMPILAAAANVLTRSFPALP